MAIEPWLRLGLALLILVLGSIQRTIGWAEPLAPFGVPTATALAAATFVHLFALGLVLVERAPPLLLRPDIAAPTVSNDHG